MTGAKPTCEACPVRHQGMFCDLGREDLRDLGRSHTANTYSKRSIIFYEGNPAMGIFCVASGKVKIYKHGINGQIQIVRLARPGDLLGYRALLAGEPYSATAEVIEEAVICFLDKTMVLSLIRRNPPLSLRLLRKVAQELRVSEERMLDLVQKPVTHRVATLLLALQQQFGETSPRGIRLNISLTREEMAEMIGTTAESLIRTLSEFRQRGLIELDAHEVRIKNPQLLATYAPAAEG